MRQSNVKNYFKDIISRMELLRRVTHKLILIPMYGILIYLVFIRQK